jgi:hypothetical protein
VPIFNARRTPLIALVALLVGCATGGPPFKPDSPSPGMGLLYLYRPSSMVGAGNHYVAAINGKPTARLKSGSYLPVEVTPGTITISRLATSALGWGLGSIVGALEGFVETSKVEARPGQTYFIHFPRGTRTDNEAEALADMAGSERLTQLQ